MRRRINLFSTANTHSRVPFIVTVVSTLAATHHASASKQHTWRRTPVQKGASFCKRGGKLPRDSQFHTNKTTLHAERFNSQNLPWPIQAARGTPSDPPPSPQPDGASKLSQRVNCNTTRVLRHTAAAADQAAPSVHQLGIIIPRPETGGDGTLLSGDREYALSDIDFSAALCRRTQRPPRPFAILPPPAPTFPPPFLGAPRCRTG